MSAPAEAPAGNNYGTMKLTQLKEACRVRGLKVSGTKPQLIDRLEGREITTPSRKRKSSSLTIPDDDEGAAPGSAVGSDHSWVHQVEPADVAKVQITALRKSIAANVKTYHKMVDADWHDGYEEQGEAIRDYFKELQPSVQAIYNIAVLKGVGFQHCSEVLVVIADFYQQLASVPSRCGIEDCHCELVLRLTREGPDKHTEFHHWARLLPAMWMMVILAAIKNGADKGLLIRMIRDCTSFVDVGFLTPESYITDPALLESAPQFEELLESKAASSLPSRKKAYARKRVIDRRFDGPKHRRTRDYSDSDSDAGSDGDSDDDGW